MAVKVMITRTFKEGKSQEVFALLKKHRSLAMDQPGYITGESLIGHDEPQKLLVISTWQSVENWLKWKVDPIRIANEAKLEQYLEGPTRYEVYILGTYPQKKHLKVASG